MTGYNTGQRRALIECLEANSRTPLTIGQIIEKIPAGASAPGGSTVYRLMNKLVEEGAVIRHVKGNSRTFLYQLAGCGDMPAHLHLKCTDCGRLIHLDSGESERVFRRVMDNLNFEICSERTVLFGRCAEHAEEEA